jgi:hypothetical protein
VNGTDKVRPPSFQTCPTCRGAACRARLYFIPAPETTTFRLRSLRGKCLFILARHCWRALLDDRVFQRIGDQVSILARHCWRALRCWSYKSLSNLRFNPRPPLLAGATLQPRTRFYLSPCFNPRPPLLAGATIHCLTNSTYLVVSILARHCWRALPKLCFFSALSCLFQSSPAIAGGRYAPQM